MKEVLCLTGSVLDLRSQGGETRDIASKNFLFSRRHSDHLFFRMSGVVVQVDVCPTLLLRAGVVLP